MAGNFQLSISNLTNTSSSLLLPLAPAADNNLSSPIQRLVLILYAALTLAYTAYSAIILYSIRHLQPCPPQARAIGHVAVAELLYMLLALVTTLINSLGHERLPATWCNVLVSIKSWMVVMSMIGQSVKALETYWFICHPLYYTDAMVGRVASVLAPSAWVLGLLLSIGAMIGVNDHGPMIFQYTMLLCEHPRFLQAYLAQGIVFGLSLVSMVFSTVTVLWTTYRHINMDKEVRKIRVHLIRPTKESSSLAEARAEVDTGEPEAGPSNTMTASKTCISLDDGLGAIPENAEQDDFPGVFNKEKGKDSYPELYVRPAGPNRMQRGSVVYSVDSIEMLNQMDHDETMRRISTTARYGSPREFRYGRPVELYFRISTCTTVANENHPGSEHLPLNSLSSPADPDAVPRIEVISPTTAGGRSQPSTVVSEYSVPSSDANTPDPQASGKSTCGVQTTLDDVKADVTSAWEGMSEENVEVEPGDDGGKDRTESKASSPHLNEVMDLKFSCSVRDLGNAANSEDSVSMNADVSCKVNSQGHDNTNGRRSLDAETSFRITGKKSSECSVTAKVEINPSPPVKDQEKGFEFKRKDKDSESAKRPSQENSLKKESPPVSVLNQENLSKFNKSFNDISSLKSTSVIIKPKRSRSFSDKFSFSSSSSNKKSCNCQPKEWTIEYNNQLSPESSNSINNNQPAQTKLSITRQLTIKDLLADDGSITSMQDCLSPLNEQRPSDIARRRKVMSFCKVVTKTLLYILQWLPMGVYIIWASLQTVAPTSEAWHFGIQLGCQGCVLLGSSMGLAMCVRNCEELRKAMRAIIQCHLAQVGPMDDGVMGDDPDEEHHGGGLPI